MLPLSFILYYWKSAYPEVGLRFLFFYSIFTLAINGMIYEYGETNAIYAVYTSVELMLFIGFLFVQIKSRVVRHLSLMTCAAFILFNIVYTMMKTETKDFDSVPIGIETIIVLVFTFYYLYERMNDTTTLYIYSSYPFWVVIGMVLYLSCNFFIYIFASTLPQSEVQRFWFVTNIFSILKNILFTVAIIMNSKPPKKPLFTEYDLSSLN